jgi:hypothetical protein
MSRRTVRDRLWLWVMKVNALQAGDDFGALGFRPSTMTVEEATAKTGIRNVLMTGNLEIDQDSPDMMPSAQRIICKWSFHRDVGKRILRGANRCLRLSARRPRIADAIAAIQSDSRLSGADQELTAPQ